MDTERIFEAATKNGLAVRAHVCQLSETVLWPLLRFHPASFDHMDHVNEDDIQQLAKRDTMATLVPGANYFLGLENYPPARRLIDAGVPVALATDYNPGSSPTPAMPFVLSLACTHMKMSPEEAIAAATINGAWSLGLQNCKGSIDPGKDADLAIFDVKDYREIPYWFGTNRCASRFSMAKWLQAGRNWSGRKEAASCDIDRERTQRLRADQRECFAILSDREFLAIIMPVSRSSVRLPV